MQVDIFPDINIPHPGIHLLSRAESDRDGRRDHPPVRAAFLQASYVEHIESQSLAGISYIKVFFQPEYGIDAAQSELTSLAYSIIRVLPPGVFPPSVYKFGVASLPIGLLTVVAIRWEKRTFAIWLISQCGRKWRPFPASRRRRYWGEGPTDHGLPRSTTYVGARHLSLGSGQGHQCAKCHSSSRGCQSRRPRLLRLFQQPGATWSIRSTTCRSRS